MWVRGAVEGGGEGERTGKESVVHKELNTSRYVLLPPELVFLPNDDKSVNVCLRGFQDDDGLLSCCFFISLFFSSSFSFPQPFLFSFYV